MIAWCYPILFWGLIASLLVNLAPKCVADKGPRTLPLVCAAMTLIPIQGMPFGRFLHGLTFGFSIPTVVLTLNILWITHSGRPLLSKATKTAMCVAGTAFGAALYPMYIGLGTPDLYALGWTPDSLLLILIPLTCVLIWISNAFGYVLVLSAVAWQIGLLESTNIWDYLFDPVYFLSSLVTLLLHSAHAINSVRRRGAHTKSTTTMESQVRTAA